MVVSKSILALLKPWLIHFSDAEAALSTASLKSNGSSDVVRNLSLA